MYSKLKGEMGNRVQSYVDNMPGELYCTISPDNASGQMAHGFFESDLEMTIMILGKMLN